MRNNNIDDDEPIVVRYRLLDTTCDIVLAHSVMVGFATP